VHALAQYIDFNPPKDNMEPDNLLKAVNSVLPKDIRILSVLKAEDDFHARYKALYREYTYFIFNNPVENPFFLRYSWHIKEHLDIQAMKNIKHLFEGEKDFGFVANEPEHKNCVRKVHFIRIKRIRGFVIINIRANGFLRGMVRNIVGILAAFGRNTLKINFSDNIIRSHTELKSLKAPPNGLFLTKVNYLRGCK